MIRIFTSQLMFKRFPNEPATGSCLQIILRLDFRVNFFFLMDGLTNIWFEPSISYGFWITCSAFFVTTCLSKFSRPLACVKNTNTEHVGHHVVVIHKLLFVKEQILMTMPLEIHCLLSVKHHKNCHVRKNTAHREGKRGAR